jgi:hypothetical protein
LADILERNCRELGLAEKVVKVDKDWVGDVKKLKQMHKKPIK